MLGTVAGRSISRVVDMGRVKARPGWWTNSLLPEIVREEVATSARKKGAKSSAPFLIHGREYLGQYLLSCLVGYNGCMTHPLSKPIILKNLSGLGDLATSFVKNLKPTKTEATIFGLSGDLGSGKTAFVKEVATRLGINKEEVTSPTFVIEKIYSISHPNFTHLIHIDAYRLNKSEELLNLGWQEILENKNNIIFIEWAELVPECIPKKGLCKIDISHIDEERRGMEIML